MACYSGGSRSSLARPRASLSGVQYLGGSSSRSPSRAPRANRIWRACARPFPRRSMDMALAFCPPTEPFRAARRRAGPCGGHIAHGQALEGSVARYRSCHSVLIANVGSIRRVCHSNHVLNQTAARPMYQRLTPSIILRLLHVPWLQRVVAAASRTPNRVLVDTLGSRQQC